jgi:N-acetylglucosamine-6-sulfatase
MMARSVRAQARLGSPKVAWGRTLEDNPPPMRPRRWLAALTVSLPLAGGSGCGGSPAGPTPDGPPPARPNFVVVIADDMAYGLFGPGRRFSFLSLPNLEKLAARGAFFENAFVTTALCSPSRATLLSGLYAHRHGVLGNELTDLSPAIATYPQILHGQGYETAHVGKWHMNSRNDMPRPGYDHWVSFHGQGAYEDQVLNVDGRTVARPGYITDVLTEEAVNWLRQPHPRPFLLVLAHKAPHQPGLPAARHAGALAGASLPEPASFHDTFADKPAWQRRYVRCGGTATAYAQCPDPQPAAIPPWPWAGQDATRLDYLRTLLAVDESLGRVMATLDGLALTSSTYVVFVSDNGFLLGEHRLGDKRLAFEESLRVPFVVAGPGVAAHAVTGTALNLDLAPTILDLAGVPVPGSMQGLSLAGTLRGQGPPARDAFLYEYDRESFFPVIPDIRAIRTRTRKYVTYTEAPSEDELYDLATDPDELVNLATRPEWAAARSAMRLQLDRLEVETGAQP